METYEIVANRLKNFYISQNHINEILYKDRQVIAHYIKIQYILEDISEKGKKESFSVDESNFSSIDNRNLLVLGAINSSSKKLRLEITYERNTDTLKKFIYTHIKHGNTIVTDIWTGYNWLGNDINYNHSTHCHGHGNFS